MLAAATSGSPKFFLGTDSAPHPKGAKVMPCARRVRSFSWFDTGNMLSAWGWPASEQESACGCAGIYSAPVALALYAQAFVQAGALSNFEAFASFNGPDFYGLPRNEGCITLRRHPWTVPDTYEFGGDVVVPMFAGQQIEWRVVED